jgi:hypothetical protein
MVWDGEKIIMFGGVNGSTNYSDLWWYYPVTNSWIPQYTSVTPSARNFHSMVWDGEKVIMFGGTNVSGNRMNDLWCYYPLSNTWYLKTPAGSLPAARCNHSMIWDSVGQRIVMFGGSAGLSTSLDKNDLWSLSAGSSAPSGFNAIVVSSNRIDLSWLDNTNNETGFKIERKFTINGAYQEIGTTNANITTYSDTISSFTGPYYYRVKAYNSYGNSDYSDEAYATTSVSLNTPSNLTATAVPSSQIINLLWQDNNDNENGFIIERSLNGTSYEPLTTTNVNVNSYSDSNINSGITYYYRVKAYIEFLGSNYFSDYSNITSTSFTRITFNYTGAMQTWVVPDGVTSIQVDAQGAGGGFAGSGNGARVQTTITVTPGTTLYLYVGGDGAFNGGWNSGGLGGYGTDGPSGIGGGGASDIRKGGTTLNDRIVVAGGGGSGGFNNGGAGGENGSAGVNGAEGGTQSAGGAGQGNGGTGTLGIGGNGGDTEGWNGGGGGGGGYYGGGAGDGGGGGGGSSYSSGMDTTYTSGYNYGNGQIIISY